MQVKNKSNRRKAFTIVELLTVMSIIIILIGLLVPALNQVKRYAKEVKQHAQFHSIDVAMELYETEHDGYPSSDENGSDGVAYCGAMKLAEAMVGQDLSGFHLDSAFRSDLMDPTAPADYLYAIPDVAKSITDAEAQPNRQSRRGPYLGIENANATRMDEMYGSFGVFGGNMNKRFVLCDEYSRTMNATGIKAGMPILYFRANLSGTVNPNEDNSYNKDYAGRIYLYEDNDDLLALEAPWASGVGHPMYSLFTVAPATGPQGPLETFYWRINNDEILLTNGQPWRADSYLLLSAGFDGLYGTRDDIYNFQEK